MSSVDILELFAQSDFTFNMETMMNLVFLEYVSRKQEIRNIYDHGAIPQNLIKLYYSRDVNHSDFKNIISNFKDEYLNEESELENIHSKEEIEGLGEAYDYIRSDDWQKCPNIYMILEINLKLFSKTPHPEAGGKFRNSNSYMRGSGINVIPYNQISTEICKLYKNFEDLLNEGIELGRYNNVENEDNLIKYIDKCLKLKCKLIEIHPFQDGNGRTMRALVNLLFKLAGLPPIYVKLSEKENYLKAMNKAIIDKNYSYINKFYYYKICDSILELDVNRRINNNKKLIRK